jgi:hypothetical protein
MDDSSGDGRGADENWVIGDGQTLLTRTSISWEGAAAAMIAARELDDVDELDIALEFSFSIVCLVKYGDENPCG